MEVSTLNSTTTTESSRQLIGDDTMQSHQPKSQLIISTKTINNSQSIDNSEPSPSKCEPVSLNHNNNHDVARVTSARPGDEPIVSEQTVISASTEGQDLHLEVKLALRQLIDRIVSNINNLPFASNAQSITNPADNTLNINGSDYLNTKEDCDDDLDDMSEGKAKDMVILKNLSPSPQLVSDKVSPTETDKANGDISLTKNATTKRASKRRLTATPDSVNSELNQSNEVGGRSKRQRTQTKFFQLGDAPKTDRLSNSLSVSVCKNTTSAKKPTRTSTGGKKSKTTQEAKVSTAQESVIQYSNDLSDVICYEKNDFLAIRNEENTFYLCQLAENVRARRQFIKVKWLDTSDDGRTYFLTPQYDKVPQKSIIMPVNLNKMNNLKKGGQIFTLDDQAKDNVLERLRRSLNATATSETASSQEM